jgi:hypothetical protein
LEHGQVCSSIRQVVLHRERHRLCARGRAELAEDRADVDLDGGAADDQPCADLCVGQSMREQRQYVVLAVGQIRAEIRR